MKQVRLRPIVRYRMETLDGKPIGVFNVEHKEDGVLHLGCEGVGTVIVDAPPLVHVEHGRGWDERAARNATVLKAPPDVVAMLDTDEYQQEYPDPPRPVNLQPGKVTKGGINGPPTTPRPEPPKGKGIVVAPSTAERRRNELDAMSLAWWLMDINKPSYDATKRMQWEMAMNGLKDIVVRGGMGTPQELVEILQYGES